MTMQIQIKGVFKPRGKDEIDLHPGKEISIRKGQLTFSIKTGDKQFTLIEIHELDEASVAYLEDAKNKLPRNEAIEALFIKLKSDATNILKSLKYFYGIYRFDERLFMTESYTWSKNGKDWNSVPDKRETKWIPGSALYVLPDNLFALLLKCQEEGITPFYAFDHLHKAFADEFNARHQWVNATIALELAFKEFLGRYDSRTIFLIENVPSPPLHKLYKNVLKDYTGEESPYVSIIRKGVETRNELVHHPGSPGPTHKDTLIYLHQCECAILHLYTLLHKGNAAVDYFYKLAQGRLERLKKLGYS